MNNLRLMVPSRGAYHNSVQHNLFSATTSLLYASERSSPPCSKHSARCSSVLLEWPDIGQSKHQLAVYCRSECSVQLHPFLVLGSAIAHASISCCCSNGVPTLSPVPLACRKSSMKLCPFLSNSSFWSSVAFPPGTFQRHL